MIEFTYSFKAIDKAIYVYDILVDIHGFSELINEPSIDGIIKSIRDNYTRHHAFEHIGNIAPSIKFVSAVNPSTVSAHDVIISSGTVIKAGVVENVSIGNHTVIGAASLVLKSIGDRKLAYGNPITTIRNRKLDSKYYG